jgi:hypothetical protein
MLPDQSFRSDSTSDLTLLKKVETAIAAYANDLMGKLGKYQPFPNSNAGAGTQTSGFFPRGVVDVKKTTFAATGGAGPVKADDMSPNCPAKTNDGDTVTILKTSEELTLTQHTTLDLVGRYHTVSESSHLLVFGNLVYIHGKISAPGKHIVIVAREVRTIAAGGEQAEINVDGAPPGKAKLQKPQAQGGTAEKDADWEMYGEENRPVWATRGTNGHDGTDGDPGDPGNAGGEIYVLCDTLPASSALTLHATGGAGQDGQPGQKGGDGGPGGKGSGLIWVEYGDSYQHHYRYVPPAPGGLWGFGGRGGPGGQGGISGNCIVIVNKAIDKPTTSPEPITVVAQPGAPGQKGGAAERLLWSSGRG